jgi:integrase
MNRRLSLSTRALRALDEIPRRFDTRLILSSPRGAHIDVHNWRRRDWKPALEAEGLPTRRPYDLRHSLTTRALDAGLSIFELARYMSTSVEMIDRTYGHLAKGAENSARLKLDAYAVRDNDGGREPRPSPLQGREVWRRSARVAKLASPIDLR